MIFSEKSQTLLSTMCIKALPYSKVLLREFGYSSIVFNQLLETFNAKVKINNKNTFTNFWESHSKESFESKICNWAYELYNNLRRFYSGGVFKLFTTKQVEWGAPDVMITKEHVKSSDINLLNVEQTIYRGMSLEEHTSKNYRQSWTLDCDIAIKFANDTYSDWNNRVVIKTVINKKDIIYYDKSNGEQEVIIKSGSVKEGHEIKI